MSDKPNRRQVLQAFSSTTAAAMMGLATASQPSGSARLVEAGIEYVVPNRPDYELGHTDSHPPYAVDSELDLLLIPPWAHEGVGSQASRGPMIDERSANRNSPVHVVAPNTRVRALPIGLSGRKRVTDSLHLKNPLQLPTVTVHWNENAPSAAIQSVGMVNVSPGESKAVELEPETVEVRIVSSTDGSDEGSRVIQREEEYAQIEATPVVHIVDHGDLDIQHIDSPGQRSE